MLTTISIYNLHCCNIAYHIYTTQVKLFESDGILVSFNMHMVQYYICCKAYR